jgi:hypothetical protein
MPHLLAGTKHEQINGVNIEIKQDFPLNAYRELTLCISTAHIPLNTAKALGGPPTFVIEDASLFDNLAYSHWGTYGWIIHCSPECIVTIGEAHKELKSLMELCISKGSFYLKLGCDAPELPLSAGYPLFVW